MYSLIVFIRISLRMKTIIHVNQAVIRSNLKNKKTDPVLTVKNYKDNQYAHEVLIKDKHGNLIGKVVHSPEKPLSCGARVWLEFYSDHVDLEILKELQNNLNVPSCKLTKKRKNDSNHNKKSKK